MTPHKGYQGYPDSYYAATANAFASYPALQESCLSDVCVIGGGYTGLSAALHLAERGYQVVLLEAERIAWGASGRNGGQLGSGQRRDQTTLEQLYGLDCAKQLWQLGEASKQLVKKLISEHGIGCDLKPGILETVHKKAWLDEERRNVEKLQQTYHYPHVQFIERAELMTMLGTEAYWGGALDTDAAHLHPLNYALGLAQAAQQQGAKLFENSRVQRYQRQNGRWLIQTAQSNVTADHVLLACNGYLDKLEPRLAGYIMPLNNFILATAPLAQPKSIIRDDAAVADSKYVINYFRLSQDGRLLFGGGENYTRHFPTDLKQFVRRYMLKIYPQLAKTPIDYAWGGTLAITLRRMPHLGQLESDLWFAQGYSGHGVGMATLAGQLLAEAISGTTERFDILARLPTPKLPGGRRLRWPLQTLGMLHYALRDRL